MSQLKTKSTQLIGVGENAMPPPTSILSTSPVPMYMYHSGQQLPLSLILLITSHLDNVRDLSSVTRASRLLYYLNLPRLYENVTLRSYPEIRYFDGRPEGFGAGSPFAMALDGLVSRNVAGFVKTLRLVGDFKEYNKDEFEKGRIPDNTMMLNIVIRAAIEKMDKIKAFTWELNSNPMRTVYQGLSSRNTLTSLTLQFPSSRIPRPTTTIPGIPSLEYLHLVGMDPLCYNDDPSLLLLQSRKLSTLKLEWSPRMRREREPSVQLNLLFGRCYQARYRMPVKHFGMKNLFCRRDVDMEHALDPDTVASVTLINCIDPSDPATVFVDSTWINRKDDVEPFKNIKRIRMDGLDQHESSPMNFVQALEEIYLIDRDSHLAVTNGAGKSSPQTPVSAEHAKLMISMGSEYLAAITRVHGKSLKRVLLSRRWALSEDVLKTIFTECPNIEEFGAAVKGNDINIVHAVIHAAPNLKAFRMLFPPGDPFIEEIKSIADETHFLGMGREMKGKEFDNIKYVGMGPLCFELGKLGKTQDPRNGEILDLRIIKRVSLEQVKDVGIWREDTLEL